MATKHIFRNFVGDDDKGERMMHKAPSEASYNPFFTLYVVCNLSIYNNLSIAVNGYCSFINPTVLLHYNRSLLNVYSTSLFL